jgi:hypothetical protein
MSYTTADLDLSVGGPEFADERVVLAMTIDPETSRVRAALLPRSIRTATPELAALYADCQGITTKIAALAEDLDALVPEMREAGASWSAIGWCCGISREAAYQRWGRDE